MIFWGKFLSLGNKKKIGKNWEFLFSKVNLIQKCSTFLKKTPNFQLGEVFFLNFEVQQYWGTSLKTFQLNW